jgi:hypothetical protein
MKIKIWYLLLLLMVAGCGDDGLGKTPLFGYSANNGEAPLPNDGVPVSGATVKAYSTAQDWIDGNTPLKTFTTDSKGRVESNDVFPATAVFFTESGAMNNWPVFLSQTMNTDPNIPDRRTAYATLYNTLMQNFITASGKTYLISDVLVNGVSVFASVDACSKDNYITLTKDAKLKYYEGANVCVGKSPLQTFDIPMIMGTKGANEATVNGVIAWGLFTVWPDAGNMVYIKKDFTQILFQVNNGNVNVTVYTLQI